MRNGKKKSAGFTLVEIMVAGAIGAAIIAVAVVAFTRSERRAAIKNVSGAIQSYKAALSTFTQKVGGQPYPPYTYETATGTIPTTGALLGAATAAVVSNAATLDNVLLAEGCMEHGMNLNVGTNLTTTTGSTAPLLWNTATNVFYCNPDAAPGTSYAGMTRLICAVSTVNVPGVDGTNYYLDPSLTALPANSRVVTLVIPGVQATEAADIANSYGNMSTATAAAANTFGAITYAAPVNGVVTLYCFVAKY